MAVRADRGVVNPYRLARPAPRPVRASASGRPRRLLPAQPPVQRLALLLQRAASATEPSGALLGRELELALLLQQQLELGHPRLVRKEARE